MPTPAVSPHEPGRRKTLALLVNTTVAVIGGAFSALLGVFAVRPAEGRDDRALDPGRDAGRSDAQCPRASRALGASRRRLVPRPRARDGVPRVGRRQAGQGVLGDVHATLAVRCSGTARRRSSGAPATAVSTTPAARCSKGLRRDRSRQSTPASTRLTKPCWCGCDERRRRQDAAAAVARRADRLPCGASRPARRGDSGRHGLDVHARQRAPRAHLDPVAHRRLPDALLRADARSCVRQRALHQQHDVGPPRPRASSFRRELSRRVSRPAPPARRRARVVQAAARDHVALRPGAHGARAGIRAHRVSAAVGSARLLGDGRDDQHLEAGAGRG